MAAAALAAVVWLTLSYRSDRIQAQAEVSALKGDAISDGEARAGVRKARQARAFQPDAGPLLLEWLLLDLQGRHRESEAVARRVARIEPANPQAWFLLAEHARDPALAREALGRFRGLRPAPARR
jgi:hypothetical protein